MTVNILSEGIVPCFFSSPDSLTRLSGDSSSIAGGGRSSIATSSGGYGGIESCFENDSTPLSIVRSLSAVREAVSKLE